MCLRKSNIHKGKLSLPFVAENDIIVYKALDHLDTDGNKCCCTPYQYFPITFIYGMCILNAVLEKEKNFYVNIGIHSFSKEKRCDNTCSIFIENEMKKHWAVIPKGSEYFVGIDDDIVSDNLIIFNTREDFEKYESKNKCVNLNLELSK